MFFFPRTGISLFSSLDEIALKNRILEDLAIPSQLLTQFAYPRLVPEACQGHAPV